MNMKAWMSAFRRSLMDIARVMGCAAVTYLALSHLAELSGQMDDRPIQIVYVIACISGWFPFRAQLYYAAALLYWWAWMGVFFESGDIPPMPVFVLLLVLPTAAFWFAIDRWCARMIARGSLARDVAEIMERDR
jgi:hypothetical protein